MVDKKYCNLVRSLINNGELPEKEHEFIISKAIEEGVDVDELEIIIESMLSKSKVGYKNELSTKIGTIKKCPACGATISFESKCPECGYVFNSISATSSVKNLFEELKSLNSKDTYRKKQIIESFPIPRSKEDILEFLILLKPKASDPNEKFNRIFLNKYSECLEKSKVYFPQDPDFAPFIEAYPSIKKTQSRGSFGRFIRKHKLLLIMIVFGAFFAIPELYYQIKLSDSELVKNFERESTDEQRKEREMQFLEYVNDGEIEKASTLVSIIESDKYHNVEAKRIVYRCYIERGDFQSAEIYVNRGDYNEYYSFLADVISYYCQHGKFDEAKRFILKKINDFDESKNSIFKKESNKNNKEDLKKNLYDIIESYRK